MPLFFQPPPGVSSLNNQIGALVLHTACQHRVTLVSNTPVMTANASAINQHFLTPYQGDSIVLFDGTNFVPTVFPQVSQLTTDTTKSPAAVAANSVYDIFAWNDGGTQRATRGPAWTNDTTRSAGTALTMVNGILLNSVAITNGPAAQRGTWVATLRSNGTSTFDWILGSAASGGGAASLHVWNAYNRVLVGTAVTDTAAAYIYATATLRQANASAGNQVSFVTGAAEDIVYAAYNQNVNVVQVLAANGTVAIGLDSTTAAINGVQAIALNNQAANTGQISMSLSAVVAPQLGRHFIAALEKGDGNNNIFNGTFAAGTLMVYLRM